MRLGRSWLLAAAFAFFAIPLRAQTLALTFDDGLDPRSQPNAAAWNANILDTLAAAGVKATFFPAGRFVDSPAGLALVRDWSKAGHAIGNHTYSHTDLNTMSVADYAADIERADAMFSRMAGWKARLRFPYLSEGDTAAKRDGVRAWMDAHGYVAAPVSIATSDWYFAQRLAAWSKAHPDGDLEPFRDAYLRHVVERADYTERLARETLGRSPVHVMLLHTNQVNALFLADVIATLRARGWTIVGGDAAFSDPLYRERPKHLPAGNSIVTALARDAGRIFAPPRDDDHGKATLDALGY